MRYRLQRHDGTDCSATMVPITVLRMVPIQRYRHKFYGYQEDPDILLRIGKENKQYRKLLKELGASPKKLLWIEKWC